MLLLVVSRRFTSLASCYCGRSPWPPALLGRGGVDLGARVTREGRRGRPPHPARRQSYQLARHSGARRVDEMRLRLQGRARAPLIHWLADQNATVYVKRTHRKGAKDQAIAVARALEGDKPVAVFPEGTTGPGTISCLSAPPCWRPPISPQRTSKFARRGGLWPRRFRNWLVA